MDEEKTTQVKKSFSENDLSTSDRAAYKLMKSRVKAMQEARKRFHYGVNLETLWSEADRDYVPHRLKTKGKRIIATDEDKGWRGALVTIGDTDWQSDLANANPFVKIQTALSILVDQNPGGVFTAGSKKFEATTELQRQLYKRSWEIAKSKQQLKLFVHNLAKYGWACARTYPFKLVRKVKIPIEYDTDGKPTKYDEKEVITYNDIFRENLNPHNTWLDDMAKPNNDFTLRDWCFRKVYSLGQLKEMFPEKKYPRMKFVQPGGTTTETIDSKSTIEKTVEGSDLTEMYLYENQEHDSYIVELASVPIIIEPLPISDISGAKKLSLWQTYWNIRHAESPYGIGIYEAIRYDNAFLDKVRNMTVDQLVFSIYKMFFYTGTQALTDTGEIKIVPGLGKQVLNPKDINWLEVPGPGKDAYAGLEMFKKDVDTDSGIGDPLLGDITGKTAFELAQAKEAALKRLKTPLDNILDALVTEAYITVCVGQLIYSVPEIYRIADPVKIDDYLKEIKSDTNLFERRINSETGEDDFYAKVYPEFPMNLEEDEKGNLIETEETRFFRIKPFGLLWAGIINIKAESILSPSKQIDKALDLEMYNMLIPLVAQPPELYLKIAKNLCKLYDKDPRDILPDLWLQPVQEQPLFVPQQQAGSSQQTPIQSPQAPQFVSRTQAPENPKGMAGRIMSKLTGAFR